MNVNNTEKMSTCGHKYFVPILKNLILNSVENNLVLNKKSIGKTVIMSHGAQESISSLKVNYSNLWRSSHHA